MKGWLPHSLPNAEAILTKQTNIRASLYTRTPHGRCSRDRTWATYPADHDDRQSWHCGTSYEGWSADPSAVRFEQEFSCRTVVRYRPAHPHSRCLWNNGCTARREPLLPAACGAASSYRHDGYRRDIQSCGNYAHEDKKKHIFRVIEQYCKKVR